jgi:acyl carrier protein
MSEVSVQDRVVALVKDILTRNAMTVEVQSSSRLTDIGLTSMDMVSLMLAVEAEFEMTIPQSDITPDNFQSPQSIEQLVARQLHAAAA